MLLLDSPFWNPHHLALVGLGSLGIMGQLYLLTSLLLEPSDMLGR